MTRATLSRLALLALVCWLWSEVAFAQSYPTRPVTITSTFANSSAATLVTRVLADKLSSIWPQRVVVEARPGASGTLAIRSVKNAEPDGYSLVAMGDSHVVINPAIYGNKLPYDPEADFIPIAMIYSAPFFSPYPQMVHIKALVPLLMRPRPIREMFDLAILLSAAPSSRRCAAGA